MSRDLTPKELRIILKANNIIENLIDLQVVLPDGTMSQVYSDEDKAIHHKYPTLSVFGGDLIDCCQDIGVFSSEEGCQLIKTIEDYFNGKELEDKELLEKTLLWYDGQFCPGHYMDNNNREFAEYLKSKISKIKET
jgi:hypothetical protein